jgi:hypothetical protein
MTIKNENSLYEFFLKTGRTDKINIKWALENKDFLLNYYPKAFAFFFPDDAEQMDDEAADELHYLNTVCGRDK